MRASNKKYMETRVRPVLKKGSRAGHKIGPTSFFEIKVEPFILEWAPMYHEYHAGQICPAWGLSTSREE
jgi:hypothetical protein